MKKVNTSCGFCSCGFAAKSQDVDPKPVLDKTSSVYKAMPGYEISFVQKIISESEVIDRLNGEAFVAKEKFLIKFQEQHICCNGPGTLDIFAIQELTH